MCSASLWPQSWISSISYFTGRGWAWPEFAGLRAKWARGRAGPESVRVRTGWVELLGGSWGRPAQYSCFRTPSACAAAICRSSWCFRLWILRRRSARTDIGRLSAWTTRSTPWWIRLKRTKLDWAGSKNQRYWTARPGPSCRASSVLEKAPPKRRQGCPECVGISSCSYC